MSNRYGNARYALIACAVAAMAILLSACGQEESTGLGERIIPLGQPVPKGGGRYQVGVPYEINGVRYTPHEDPNYDRTGIASWYGELFHGRYTANGEIYDMDRLSAAHPTLPLPVYVHVTNLKNGRSLIVRVNDRGPFRKGRIIDLSRRSADILGFRQRGTAPVRVRYLRRAPLNGDDSYEQQYRSNRAYAQGSVKAHQRQSMNSAQRSSSPPASAPPLPDRTVRPVRTASLVSDPAPTAPSSDLNSIETQATGIHDNHVAAFSMTPHEAPLRLGPASGPAIQAGTFMNWENVERARTVLSDIAPVDVRTFDVAGETYYRVLVGPFTDGIEAAAALPLVTDAGYRGAKILLQN